MQLTAIDSAPLIRLNYKKFKEHLLLPSRVRRKIGNRGGAHPELISVHRDLGFWVFLGPGNSERHSWNLRCVRNGAELRVEVKGTTSTGDSVELTAAEVNYATRGAPPVHLAVVSNIKIDNTKTPPLARGGDLYIYKNFTPSEHKLEATRFRCTLDHSRRKHI